MGEMHISTEDRNELRPPFLWKITRNDDDTFSLDPSFKMSKDGSKHIKKAVANTVKRALGNTDQWMKGDVKWTWDLIEK